MGYLVPEEYLEWLDKLDLQVIANNFIIVTPLFSYGTTCYGIWKKKSSVGFSIDICATMFMASILRILYYFNTKYEVSLLRQSIVMLFIQSILLKVALRFRRENYSTETLEPLPSIRKELESSMKVHLSDSRALQLATISDEGIYNWLKRVVEYGAFRFKVYAAVLLGYVTKFFDVHYKRPKLFWQWEKEMHYWSFLFRFGFIFSFLTLLFRSTPMYGAFIGTLGLFIESLLPLPQILMLSRLKSVQNFKLILLLSWLGGDLTKISYLLFGASNISIIFIMAALFQMSLDIYIAYQYVYYKMQDDSPVLPLNELSIEIADL